MKLRTVLLLACVLSGPSIAQTVGGESAAKSLWEGNQLFCKNCHGRAGEGAFGPDLAGRGLSPSEFRRAVRKPWGVMPAFTEEQLSDAEIEALTSWFAGMPKVSEPAPWRVPVVAEQPVGQQVYTASGCAQCHGATFDQPRAALGRHNADFAAFKELVYSHTTAMPKFEEPRPGQRLRMGNFNSLRLSEPALKQIFDWAHDDLGFTPVKQPQKP